MAYTIGQMAERLGIAASTLRYYEQEGLLPFVARTSGGRRRFTEADTEWLMTIGCLKKTEMPLKEIRSFIAMAMEGDATIGERLALISKQRAVVEQRLAELSQVGKILEFKQWYYETARTAGSTSVPRNMDDEELPQEFRGIRRMLRGEPECGQG